MTDNKNNTEKSTLDSLKSFFSSVSDNVAESASVVAESIKTNTEKAYVAGSEMVEDANEKIHQYTSKVECQNEKKKLKTRQKEIQAEFGRLTLSHYIANESLHISYLTTTAINKLVIEFIANSKYELELDKKIEKLNQ